MMGCVRSWLSCKACHLVECIFVQYIRMFIRMPTLIGYLVTGTKNYYL